MSGPAKKNLGGLTLRRKEAFQDQTAGVALEAKEWIDRALGLTPDPEAKGQDKKAQVESFFGSISDGVRLCQLIHKIDPSVTIAYKPDAKSFQARDNIVKFLAACKTLGVPAVSLFEVDDLVERKNNLLVVNTLLYLARIGAKAGIAPPPIVQYEIEIEEANAPVAEGKEEEDDDAHEEVPPAAAAAAPAAEAKEATPAAPAAATAPAAASAASPTKAPRKLYVPDSSNSTDVALAKVVNAHNYPVTVARLQMKKGRKHDARHRGKGDYKIDGEKMFVRLLHHDTVMVRHQGEWLELVNYLNDLERHNLDTLEDRRK